MAELRQNAAMIRGEQAHQKEKRLKVIRGAPHYRIEGDDLILLSGPYADSWVSMLWNQGPEERDYIYKYVYSSRDSEAQRIVRQLFCQ
jgi:hypothetical protein